MSDLSGLYTPGRGGDRPPPIYPPLTTDPVALALWGDVLLADKALTNQGDGSTGATDRRRRHRTALDNLLTFTLYGRTPPLEGK